MKFGGRFLSLGDSYTIGEGVDEDFTWSKQLVDILNLNKQHFQNPRIIAKTGWTTGELAEAIEKEHIQENFDLVSLLIGVNNQYRGLSPEQYSIEFRALLKQSIKFVAGNLSHVIVLSIPDWGKTPFAKDRDQNKISAEIDTFNTINKEISTELNVNYCSITELSRMYFNDEYLVEDKLHYSGKMYALWAEEAFKAIKDIDF
jgi:lysophospholipase L1-like esterase